MDSIQQRRRCFVYAAIVGINIVLYAWQVLTGVNALTPAVSDMVAWGANVAPLTLGGEAWRLFTSMFLHIGLLHLALNMYMLVAFGAIAERSFGPVRFTLIYLMSGLLGSLASARWNAMTLTTALTSGVQPQLSIAAGASGALMGICGAYLSYWLLARARHLDGAQESITMRGPLAQTVAINLGMGFLLPGIDNACHIGGLLGGALLGAAFALIGSHQSMARRALATVAIALASTGALYLGLQAQPSAQFSAFAAQLQVQKNATPAVDSPARRQ
jgi:rhomboid protease GluP